MRPSTIHEPVHNSATTAPEASAVSHPKCCTRMGTREVETIPPTIPAVFINPEEAPTFSSETCTAVAQNAGSAKYSPPTLKHSAATEAIRLLASAAAKRSIPDTP